MPSSSLRPFRSSRYSSYWCLFSTLALMPKKMVSVRGRAQSENWYRDTQIQQNRARGDRYIPCLSVWSSKEKQECKEPLLWAKRTFKYSDCGWVVVYTSCGFQSSYHDGRRGDEIVGKGIVEISLERSVRVWRLPEAREFQSIPLATYLKLEYILDSVKLLLVSAHDYCQPPCTLPY